MSGERIGSVFWGKGLAEGMLGGGGGKEGGVGVRNLFTMARGRVV